MPEHIIFCWTGSGNSLYDAKFIAAALDGETLIRPMRGGVPPGVKTVGFVFPVYYWTMPAPVANFIRATELPEGVYYYAVANYGAILGIALGDLELLLKGKGRSLSYHAHHPSVANYIAIYNPFPDPAKRIPEAAERTAAIAADVAWGAVVPPPRRRVPRVVQALFHKSVSWGNFGKGFDRGYRVSADCVACGLCERLCPVGNIAMESGRPVFRHGCEHCMSCIQNCPKQALNYKNATQARTRYRHPEVAVQELADLLTR